MTGANVRAVKAMADLSKDEIAEAATCLLACLVEGRSTVQGEPLAAIDVECLHALALALLGFADLERAVELP
jgi:hypothetical protein